MKQGAKIGSVAGLLIISVVVGFIFLIRGCLAKYDEYYQFDAARGFHSSKGDVIVYLKEKYKVNSYSSGGGMTSISGTPYYYLETRDAASLKLLKSTKFEDISDPVKRTPHVIGCDDKSIWIFQGKIMAFDALTHEMVCTKEKLEETNPALKDNLPEDMSYYKYNYIHGRLEVTTKNALHFSISKTFKAQKINDVESDENQEIVDLKNLEKNIKEQRDIKAKNGDRSSFNEYYKLDDSIRKIEKLIDKKKDDIKDIKEYNKKIQESRSKGFDNAQNNLVNAVVLDSTIYALLSEKDLAENNSNFYFRKIYSDEVQRQLYRSNFNELEKNDGFFERCKISERKLVNNNISFLKGGFLLDKENLEPIKLSNPLSWLILSAKEVGNKSKLILQRVNEQGIAIWTKELPIIDFSDMVLAGDNLVMFTNDGVKITNDDNRNWIISLNLKTGDFILLDLAENKDK
jgi:hypothetical protein